MLLVRLMKLRERLNSGLGNKASMAENHYLHELAITAIILKEDRYLIIRRSLKKKRFPGLWTVPGGKLESSDYLQLPKDTTDYWYNVLERTLEREIKEEVGLQIANVQYLTSLATIHSDGSPSLVISCVADYQEGEVKLQEEEADQFAWVTSKEAKDYDLIDGIWEELVMADSLSRGKRVLWQKFPRS